MIDTVKTTAEEKSPKFKSFISDLKVPEVFSNLGEKL
jgi:hypothetical protein